MSTKRPRCEGAATPLPNPRGRQWRSGEEARHKENEDGSLLRGCEEGLACGGGRRRQLEHQRSEEVKDSGGGEGGGLPPRWGKRVPLTRVGLGGSGTAREEALPLIGETGLPPLRSRLTHCVSWIRRSGEGETRGGERSPPIPPLGGGKGGGRPGRAVWNGHGRRWERPSPFRAVEERGRGGVTNPAS